MPLVTTASVTLSVSRSRSNGRDALLVSTGDASDIGWYDLGSDTGHPVGELFSLVIDAAGAGWRQGSGSPLVPGASALVDVMAHQDRLQVYGYDGSDLGWYDLATSQAHPAGELMDLVVQAAGLAYQVGQRSAPRTSGATQLHVRRVEGRLHVTGYDGTDLGWYDLSTRTSHPTSEIMQLVVEAAGLGWQACSREQEQLTASSDVPVQHLLQAHLEGLMQDDARWRCWPVTDCPTHDALDAWLIVGPAGAFLACATGHGPEEAPAAGADGVSQLALQAALRLADQLAAHLSATARFPVPVPLVVASFGATVLPQPAGAHAISFLRGDCLPQWLRARRRMFDDAQLTLLADRSRAVLSEAGGEGR